MTAQPNNAPLNATLPKSSWSNEELRVLEQAYRIVLERKAAAGELPPAERERLAARIMSLAGRGGVDAAELAKRCLAAITDKAR